MAKSASIEPVRNDSTWRRRSSPGRSEIKTFYNDVRTEMKKVTTPSWKEVQAHDDGGHHHGLHLRRVFLGRSTS